MVFMYERRCSLYFNFFESLEKFVISPLEKSRDRLSVISLFGHYDRVRSGPRRNTLPEHTRNAHDKDRAKGNKEQKDKGMPEHVADFKVID